MSLNKIKRLKYEELNQLDIRYVFDYWDFPLSFIGILDNTVYLFYYIDDNSYFYANLNKTDIEHFAQTRELRGLLLRLMAEDRLWVININSYEGTVECIGEVEELHHYRHYIPTNGVEEQYNYVTKQKIGRDEDFKDLLEFYKTTP